MAKLFKPFHFLSLAIVFVLYLGLRAWNLTASCLWFDEIFSVHAARHDWSGLFWFVGLDLIHPPFFYVLLKLWISVGGENLLWLRLFSVIFSIVAIFPFLKLCREIVPEKDLKRNFWTVVLAFGFFATNGALIKYAQEVRMYSLVLCLSLFSLWLFLRFFRLGKNFWILTSINFLLIYTHYFGWLVVLSEIAAIIILQRIKIMQMAVMSGMLLAGFAPWIFVLWKAAQNNAGLAQNIGWIGKPDYLTFVQFVFDLIEPFYFQQIQGLEALEPPSRLVITVPLSLIFLAAFAHFLLGWKNREPAERQNFYLLLIFTAVPIFTAFFASWILPYSVWGTRHLIIVFAPLLILTAVVLNKIKLGALKVGLFSAIFCLFLLAFLLQASRGAPRYIWCAWENFAENLDRHKPQKIYVFEDLVAYNFWFALRDAEVNFQIIKIQGIENLQEDPAYFLPRGFEGIKVTDETGIEGERFWIAFRDLDWHEKHPPLRNFRMKGYRLGEPKIYQANGLKAFFVEAEKEK